MKKSTRIGGILLIGGLVVIQFFQPDRNMGSLDVDRDMVAVTGAPDNVAAILNNSCYDCHSNQSHYPWYGYISPVSWYLNKHIVEAKEDLNMSNFGNLEKKKKIGVLTEICEELESGSMPLKSYLIIHRNSKISEAEVKIICKWTEITALKMMRE